MHADFDARRLQHKLFSGITATGQWQQIVLPDPTRVRFVITCQSNFQLATQANIDSIFAYVPIEKSHFDLRRDIDGDITTGGIWFISFGESPSYWGYETIDPHGLYYEKVR